MPSKASCLRVSANKNMKTFRISKFVCIQLKVNIYTYNVFLFNNNNAASILLIVIRRANKYTY